MKNNEVIKERIKKLSCPQWMVASYLNVSERTLIVWLRKELPEAKEKMITSVLEKIEKQENK